MSEEKISNRITVLLGFYDDLKNYEEVAKKKTQLPKGIDEYYLTASVGHVSRLVNIYMKAVIDGTKLRIARAYQALYSKTGHLWSEEDRIKLRKVAEECGWKFYVALPTYTMEIEGADETKKRSKEILIDLLKIIPQFDEVYSCFQVERKDDGGSFFRDSVDKIYHDYGF